ncbi:hypothetical protein C8J56DRAFT_1058257 [Mycena floridula]|nr:hypothetical protein C8J56DRAFT_1058257 [Mycena floridula]
MFSTKSTAHMTPDQYLKGRANWPGFKTRFQAIAASLGLKDYITGDLKRPLTDPVKWKISTKTDANGNVIETTVIEEPILQTSPGSKEPLIHEWDRANMQAVVLLITCVVDPDAYGLKDTDTAAINWNWLIAKFSVKDISIQLVAEDSDMRSEFTARKKAAVDAGASITDAVAKNCLIAVVSSNGDLKSVALGLPISTTLDDAWTALESRWNFEGGRSQGASKASGSKRLPAGPNLPSDICTNPSHGPGGKGGHKTGNCWALGGANITHKPSTWGPKKSKEVTTPVAASAVATPVIPAAVTVPATPDIGANSVHCPEVFIFSASAPSLGARLTDSDSRTLAERIDMPSLAKRLHMDSPMLEDEVGNHPQLLTRIGPVASIDLDGPGNPRYITQFYTSDEDNQLYRKSRVVSSGWSRDSDNLDDGMLNGWSEGMRFSTNHSTKTHPDSGRNLDRNGLDLLGGEDVVVSEIPVICALDAVINSAENTRNSAKRTFQDSGASHTCWTNRENFIHYQPIEGQRGRAAKDGATFGIVATGRIRFDTIVDGVRRTIEIPAIHT